MTGHRLIAVVWDDAHRTAGEVEAYEIDHKPYRFTSVGILVRTDEAGVSIAGEIGSDGRFRDVDFIPRGMVVEEYPLGALRKKSPRKSKMSPSISHEESHA